MNNKKGKMPERHMPIIASICDSSFHGDQPTISHGTI